MNIRQLLSPYRVDRRAALLRFHTRKVTLPPSLRRASASQPILGGSIPAASTRRAA